MATKFVDRSHDEEIIDIVNSILSSGTWKVETFNESVLFELMKQRKTPIKAHKIVRDTEADFLNWRNPPPF